MTVVGKRASLHARLSVAADYENTSLQGMIDDMRDLCAREGLQEVALHVDDGKSGGRRDRDEFQAWLNDARSGFADVLVNPVTDRLTREGLNVAAGILDVVEGKDPATGRVVHKPVRLMDTAGLDSNHGDAFRMRFVIQAEVGRSERERIRDRTRKSVKRLRQAARWPGGTAPFGYRALINPDGPGWVLDIEPTEAAAVRECLIRLVSGQKISTVCRWLNKYGDVRPRRADQFSRQVLTKILTGPAIVGRITIDGEVRLDPVYPSIVTPGESLTLRMILATVPRARPAGGRQPSRLLSGHITCVGCGIPLTVGKRSSAPAYRCDTRSHGRLCPSPVSTACGHVEAYVERRVLEIMGTRPMTRQEIRVVGESDAQVIQEEIREVTAELAVNATAERFARLQSLQKQRDELDSQPAETTVITVDLGMTGAEWWDKALMEEKQDLVAEIFPHMVLGRGKPGRKGFDESRLPLHHGEPDHEYEAWLQREG